MKGIFMLWKKLGKKKKLGKNEKPPKKCRAAASWPWSDWEVQ